MILCVKAITYNHLNLPAAVSAPEGMIYYTYNAAGQKLRKFYDKTSGTDETTDYIDGVHYKNNVLDFIQHAEGRARKNGSTYEYEYNLTDHLGNVRVTVSSTGSVIQRDDYYPFGLTFNSWHVAPKNQYQFQGQEVQSEIGWVQFKWRNHDPTIGRFFNIDPLSEKYFYNSPYAFSENKVISHRELEGLEKIYFMTSFAHNKTLISAFSVQRRTTGGKAFKKTLSEKGANAYYFTYSGYAEGRTFMYKSVSEFEEAKSADRHGYFKDINSETVKTAMGKGGLLMIGINAGSLPADKDMALRDAASTLNHEEVAHGTDKLNGDQNSNVEDHKRYYGSAPSDGTSPNDSDVRTDPKYANSEAKGQLDEIDAIIEKDKQQGEI